MDEQQQKPTFKARLRPWLRALTNPHLLISLGLAWFITNGWSYCAVGIGWYLDIGWLMKIGTVWLGMLWMPGTPEKIVTFAIAVGLLRLLFPDDTRTLAMIRRKNKQLIAVTKQRFARFRERHKHSDNEKTSGRQK